MERTEHTITMKFEDLKLPDWSGPYQAAAIHTARAIYDQMREHYETKLVEEKPEPEELFEHPDMPGKKFRKLKAGDVIQIGDWCNSVVNTTFDGWVDVEGLVSRRVKIKDVLCFYREVQQPAPEWRLPNPPPVEYVPLGPEDVPPGSAVRPIGEQGWRLVTHVEEDCISTRAGTFDWCDLAERCEILRPGSTTWEPCKKPKA